MTNIIDILIKAGWDGAGVIKGASGDLRTLGNNAARTSVQMAAGRQRAALLNKTLASLGEEITLGNMTVEQATQAYKYFEGELIDVGEEAPKTARSLSSLAGPLFAITAGMTAATIAGKKLYGILKEGAGLELVKIRFDRLAESIGTTGDALERDLGFATRGIISDAETLALATDLMAQGLANSHDEAVRLVGVSAQLDFNVNQLVTTLTDKTTSGFDALGVSTDGFEKKVRRLEDAGHDVDEAFNLAFVEQAEEQIGRVGDIAETTAGKLLIIESNWKTTVESLKTGIVDLFSPFIEDLANTITFTKDAEQAIHELGKEVGNLEKEQVAVDALSVAISDLMERIEGEPIKGDVFGPDLRITEMQERLLQLAVNLTLTDRSLKEQFSTLRDWGFEMDASSESTEDWTISLGGLSIAMGDFLTALPEERVRRTTAEFDALHDSMGGARRELREFTDEEIQGFIDKSKELSFSLIDLGTIQTADQLAGVVGRQVQTMLDAAMGTRTDIWLDFQTDLTDISEREGERRAEVEGRYEERRTDIVDQYGEQRARKEEQTARTINRIREDSADRQVQIRDDGNRRLSDLERDHLDRMQEIIENADLQLQDAASRLDADTVARIQRQRKDAQGDEIDAFKKQRKDILRRVDERIKAEQKAADKRIKREEENNAIRLQQMEDAHREQLAELKDKHDDELQEIKDNANKARIERENNYIDERTQLDAHWRAKDTLDTKWMNAALIKEEQWWKSRLNLVGGGGGGTIDPTEDPTDRDDRGDGERPSRMWLEQTAIRVAAEKGGDIFEMSRYFKTLGDAQLAAWIEANSEIDVQGYALGGRVPRDMLALVGERGKELVGLPGGSQVFDSSLTRQFFSKAPSISIGDIIVNEAERPGETGQEVREELEKILRGLAGE